MGGHPIIISMYVVQSCFLSIQEICKVHVRSGVLHNLAVLIVNRTSYIGWFVKWTISRERMIAPVHFGPVAFLSAYAPASKSIKTVHIADNSLQLSDRSSTVFEWRNRSLLRRALKWWGQSTHCKRSTIIFSAFELVRKLLNNVRIRNGRFYPFLTIAHFNCKFLDESDKSSVTCAGACRNQVTGNGLVVPPG